MRKLFLLFVLVVVHLTSCHQDDFETLQTTSEEVGAKPKFAIFPDGDKVPLKSLQDFEYGKSFAYLIQRYDNLHQTNFSGLVNTTNEVLYNKKSGLRFIHTEKEPYIESRLVSSTYFDENGDIWVVFPKIFQDEVVGLLSMVLTEDETAVYFYNHAKESELYVAYGAIFQKYYNDNVRSSNKSIDGGLDCGLEGMPDCELEGLVILVNTKQIEKEDIEDTGGGCSTYGSCPPPPGGGSGGNNQNDPCAKTKAMLEDNEAIGILKEFAKTALRKEKGYRIQYGGAIIEGNGKEHKVEFTGGLINTKGLYHSHTLLGIKMFSPDDINSLMHLIGNQMVANYGNAYVGMVGYNSSQTGGLSFHHYIMTFSGTGADIRTYTADEINLLNIDYREFYDTLLESHKDVNGNMTAEGLEKLFYKIVEKMGLKDKIRLQRLDENNNITNITNGTNGPEENNCP